MKKKVFSLLLAGMLTFSMGTTAYATEDAIADMQAQKQQAEAGLAQTQANIDSLQSKKQELENYLSDLNTQYEDLTNAISELSIQAGEKENELKQLHTELKKAKKALNKQYDDMKLRIQYMYENGGTSALETLLSSKDLSEFLNNAESVAKISQYDRTMLEKCENLQNTIKDQETTAEEEKAAIDQLLEERAAKQQEVQNLAASTSDNISSYVSQISASQEEAAALTAEINNADNSIAQLVQRQKRKKQPERQRRHRPKQRRQRHRNRMQKRVLMIMKKIQILMRKTLRTVRILRRLKNLRIRLKIQGILLMKIHTKRTKRILMKKILTAVDQKIHLTVLHQRTARHPQTVLPVRENTLATLH